MQSREDLQGGAEKIERCLTHLAVEGSVALSPDEHVRTIQALLGHKAVSTTKVSTHVLQQGGHGVRSPLDTLQPAETDTSQTIA